MKSPSSELFELIRSLSKGEKIFFRKYASMYAPNTNNKYMQLFEGIEKQSEYDEKEVLNQNNDLAYGNQLSVTKNYLYNQILDSIAVQYDSVHASMRNQLHHVEFLFDKGLYDQSTKALMKAKVFAREHELHHALCEIFQYWEYPLALRKQDMSLLKSIIKEWGLEAERLQNVQAYFNLSAQMAVLHSQQGIARERSHMRRLKEIINTDLMQDESRAITFVSKVIYHNIYGLYWESAGDKVAKYRHFKRAVELTEKFPKKIQTTSFNYITRLNNYLSAAAELNKYPEVLLCLNKMKDSAAYAKTRLQKARHFYYYNSNLMHYYYATGNPSHAATLIPSIKSELEKYSPSLTIAEKTMLYTNISGIYFCMQDYKQCIQWLNRFRNEIRTENFPDVQATIHMIYIILHYEAKSGKDLILSLIKSDKSFFSKRKRLYKFEKILFTFFKKNMLNKFPKTNLKEEYLLLKREMTELSKDPFEKNAFRYFDFFLWVDSKIENRPIEEIAKEKLRV